MAFDEDLAGRVRALLDGEPALGEKRMFGGLAFLVDGKMALAASGQGGLMVRIDPAEAAMLTSTTAARVVEMRGRPMTGWLRLDAAAVDTDAELEAWVARGLAAARTVDASS